MSEIRYDEFLGLLFNGYNTKYHKLLERREILREARKCRKDEKSKAWSVEAYKIILEDFIEKYSEDIVSVEGSMISVQKIIHDGAPVAVDTFLRKYYDLVLDMMKCDEKDFGKMYIIVEQMRDIEYKLATIGYPIFNAFKVFVEAFKEKYPTQE